MKLKTCRIIGLSVAGLVLLLAAMAASLDSMVLAGIGFALAILDAAFFILFHRCPHCGRSLRADGDYCPYCGEKLDD